MIYLLIGSFINLTCFDLSAYLIEIKNSFTILKPVKNGVLSLSSHYALTCFKEHIFTVATKQNLILLIKYFFCQAVVTKKCGYNDNQTMKTHENLVLQCWQPL